MRPQAQIRGISRARLCRAPSRCQRFWQGILILATLALAVAAHAQTSCYDLFASRNAPLRPGNSVTLTYSFSDATRSTLGNAKLRDQVLESAEREHKSLFEEGLKLEAQLKSIETKYDRRSLATKTELLGRIRTTTSQLAQVKKIENLARKGEDRLSQENLELLRTLKFHQTFTLKKKADAALLNARITELYQNLATTDAPEKGKSPLRRAYDRVYNFVVKRKILTVVLIATMGTAGNGAYQLYVQHQDHAAAQTDFDRDGLGKTQANSAHYLQGVYYEATGAEQLAPNKNEPAEPIGN